MWCEIDDLRLWYEARGEGMPILFLHGWAMDHRDESLVYERFFADRPGYRRIYTDLPGMGKTAARQWIKNQDHYLDIVLRFIATVIGEQSFLLAGTSAGAYLARGVVHRMGARIEGLLLRVPLIVPEDAKRDVAKFARLVEDQSVMAKLMPEERQVHAEILVHSPRYLNAARKKHDKQVSPAMTIADQKHLEPIRRDPKRYGFSFDIDAPSERFGAPTLIVTGRQDINVGYRDAWRLLDNYPRASFAVLDRADHGFPIDQHNIFFALLDDWLDRVAEMQAIKS
jgi:pimeloyl-ACP methyl ester carboxylesterase